MPIHAKGIPLAWESKTTFETAREKAKEEGRKKGMEKGEKEITLNLIKAGLDNETISKITGLSTEEIQKLRK